MSYEDPSGTIADVYLSSPRGPALDPKDLLVRLADQLEDLKSKVSTLDTETLVTWRAFIQTVVNAARCLPGYSTPTLVWDGSNLRYRDQLAGSAVPLCAGEIL